MSILGPSRRGVRELCGAIHAHFYMRARATAQTLRRLSSRPFCRQSLTGKTPPGAPSSPYPCSSGYIRTRGESEKVRARNDGVEGSASASAGAHGWAQVRARLCLCVLCCDARRHVRSCAAYAAYAACVAACEECVVYLVGVPALVILIRKFKVGRGLHGRPGLNLHSRYRLHLLENVEQLDLRWWCGGVW